MIHQLKKRHLILLSPRLRREQRRKKEEEVRISSLIALWQVSTSDVAALSFQLVTMFGMRESKRGRKERREEERMPLPF